MQNLFTFHDSDSGLNFLVDTGAAVSVYPVSKRETEERQSSTSILSAANGTAIETFGQRPVKLTVGQYSTVWPFVLARVTRPILGADFLRHSGFLVDVRHKRLVQADTWDVVSLTPSSDPNHQVFHLQREENEYVKWIRDSYPALLKPCFSEPTVKHGVVLQIPKKGRPVFAKARRLPPDKLAAAKSAFEDMTRMGVTRRSKSAWSSPLHMVPKADGSWRPCGDFRRLNEITDPDKYPVPHIQDFSAQLAGCRVFSKVDLIRGYHQIPVATEDIHKTAVITPFGLYEFLRTPFGLRNAAQAFQRLMDTVCQGLEFVFVYLDDVLVASKTPDEHRVHLTHLFERFKRHGLVLNVAKCIFGEPQLKFLGHRVSAEGIKPAADRVKAIRELPQPATVRKLMEYLGMLNFYKRFVPRASHLLSPLYDATKSTGSKSALQRAVDWTTERIRAFRESKAALARAAMLSHFVQGAPIALTTDASDFAVGAVLEQQIGGAWRPLGFYSSRFKPTLTEKKRPMQLEDAQRSATDRELLAAYKAVVHFRHILEGREFTLYTDHRPLIGMMAKVTDNVTAMQARHMAFISTFTTDIRHVQGKDNPVADALSRVEIDSVSLGIDYAALAAAQKRDPELPAIRTAVTGLRMAEAVVGNTRLWCDMSNKNPRPWVPELRQTTAYHPQSNGMVERFHRQLKASLVARLTGPDWWSHLPWVMLGIRAAHKPDIGASPAEMIYGTTLNLPGQIRTPTAAGAAAFPFLEDLKKAMKELKPPPATHHQPTTQRLPHVPPELKTCRMVFVRRDGQRPPLSVKYDGPYQVVERQDKWFRLQLGAKTDTVAIDRLKPAFLADDAGPAQPPRRGRPPVPSRVLRDPRTTPPPPTCTPATATTTRAGRSVRRPQRFISNVWGGYCRDEVGRGKTSEIFPNPRDSFHFSFLTKKENN